MGESIFSTPPSKNFYVSLLLEGGKGDKNWHFYTKISKIQYLLIYNKNAAILRLDWAQKKDDDLQCSSSK